jgi:hypothetical protein
MKTKLLMFALAVCFSAAVVVPAQDVREADSKDVASVDAIMAAVYDVISGDAGKARDWDRFRSLFYKDARLIPSGKNAKTGVYQAVSLSPEDYIERSGPYLEKEGFSNANSRGKPKVTETSSTFFRRTNRCTNFRTKNLSPAASTAFSF